ncbi:MAG: efflux RND transporter periplasmic adaptor subunit [Bacteroides sp.]|nr:efflux RND transporter periplasmic adaptor subunit [Prevotella sp.]MCM1408677.1 efflux RND transporter periplasmic adaptor subunit [Treponema brennaborense]MCM1470538.1 efflux RND transporter periplasmic adaptor subunit [Bacteroides sp.]
MDTANTENKRKKADIIAKIVVCAVIVVLAAGILMQNAKQTAPAGRGGGRTGAGTAGDARQETAVTVSAVRTKLSAIENLIKVNGMVSSKSEVSIYPDTSGKITKVLKDIGDTIQKGEILAYVDPSKPGSAYSVSPVISTVSGTVVSVPVKTGETVSANTEVAAVGSLNDLKITVNVAEKYSTFLVPKLPGYVSLVSIPEQTFSAHITQVSPVVDQTKRTIEVSLDFNTHDERVKPGMFASVRLATQRSENTIVVPKSALSSYNAQTVVYVVDENMRAVRREVTAGLSNDTDIEIVSGIHLGETVITAGAVTNDCLVRIAGETE